MLPRFNPAAAAALVRRAVFGSPSASAALKA